MSLRFTIRDELPGDAWVIAEITAAAFLTHPHSDHTEQFIVAGLRRSGALFLSRVAQAEDQVVGHIAFSPVVIADDSIGWYGLGPVSVAPAFQGRGVGQSLVRNGLAALRETGAHGCVVLGSPLFYGRFGFAASPDLVFPGPPPALFQSLRFSGPHPRGEVTYHESFNARD